MLIEHTTQRLALNLTGFFRPGAGPDTRAMADLAEHARALQVLSPILLLQLAPVCAARVLAEMDERDLLDLFPVRITIAPRANFAATLDTLGVDILIDPRAKNVADVLAGSRNINRAVQISSECSRDLQRRYKGRYMHAPTLGTAIRNLLTS